MPTKVASAALAHLARHVSFRSLVHLWSLANDYAAPPCPDMKAMANGRGAYIPGVLRLLTDGSLIVHEGFGWDGPSPRVRIRYRGRTLATIGTPLGPYIDTGCGRRIRATARGTLPHDAVARHRHEIAEQVGLPVSEVLRLSDRRLRTDISEDWSPRWGRIFYSAVRLLGDAYREASPDPERMSR